MKTILKINLIALALIFCLHLLSCSKKPPETAPENPNLVEQPDGTDTLETEPPAGQQPDQGIQEGTTPADSQNPEAGQNPDSTITEEQGTVNGGEGNQDGEITDEELKNIAFETIHYEFDKSTLTEEARMILQNNANLMMDRNKIKISVTGHCDKRGTNSYNIALGLRRAQSARDYLINLGISQDRIETLSKGEEEPLASAETEEAFAINRRGEFLPKK